MLSDPRFKMHDHRGFIKRRAPDGRLRRVLDREYAAELRRAQALLEQDEPPL